MKNLITIILIIAGFLVIIIDLPLTGGFFLPIGIALLITGGVSIVTTNIVILSIIFIVSSTAGYIVFWIYSKKTKEGELFKHKKGIIQKKLKNNRYVVLFPTGFRGETIWEAYSEEELKSGDKVEIKDIDGNTLIIQKSK